MSISSPTASPCSAASKPWKMGLEIACDDPSSWTRREKAGESRGERHQQSASRRASGPGGALPIPSIPHQLQGLRRLVQHRAV